jgi:acyl carrier protein
MQQNGFDVSTAVREILAAELGIPVESIGLDDEMANLPRVDSVRVIRTIARLEKRFGVTVPDEDLFSARIVKDLVAVVARITEPAKTV